MQSLSDAVAINTGERSADREAMGWGGGKYSPEMKNNDEVKVFFPTQHSGMSLKGEISEMKIYSAKE